MLWMLKRKLVQKASAVLYNDDDPNNTAHWEARKGSPIRSQVDHLRIVIDGPEPRLDECYPSSGLWHVPEHVGEALRPVVEGYADLIPVPTYRKLRGKLVPMVRRYCVVNITCVLDCIDPETSIMNKETWPDGQFIYVQMQKLRLRADVIGDTPIFLIRHYLGHTVVSEAVRLALSPFPTHCLDFIAPEQRFQTTEQWQQKIAQLDKKIERKKARIAKQALDSGN